MLTEQEFAELQRTVDVYYGEGSSSVQDVLLNEWMYNVSKYSILRQIIQIPTASDNMLHFAFKSLKCHTDVLFASWNSEQFLQISAEFLELLFNGITRFASKDFVLRSFCEMYANIVKYGWHVSSEFAAFTDQIERFFGASGSHYAAGLMIYIEVIDKMKDLKILNTVQLNSFKGETLLKFLIKSYETLSLLQSGEMGRRYNAGECATLMNHSLQLIHEIFNFIHSVIIRTDNANSKIDQKQTCFPQEWSGKIEYDKLITLVYEAFAGSELKLQTICLDILLYISAAQRKRIAINDDISGIGDGVMITGTINSFYECLLLTISNMINLQGDALQSVTNVQNLCKVISRARLSLDSKLVVQLQNFHGFVDSVLVLTRGIFNVDFISDNPQTISHILNFWYTMITVSKYTEIENDAKVYPNQWITPIIQEVFTSFIELVENLIEAKPDEASEALFPDFLMIYPLIELIPQLATVNPEENLAMIGGKFCEARDEFFANLESENLNIFMMKLCTYSLAMASYSTKAPLTMLEGRKNTIIYDYTSDLLAFIAATDEMICQNEGGPILIEYDVLLIIKVLKNSVLTKQGQIAQPIYAEKNGIHFVQEVLSIMFRRIIHSLTFFPNEEYVVTAVMNSLEPYMMLEDEAFKEAISQVLVGELLDFTSAKQLAFMENPENAESCLRFFSIIAKIMKPNIGVDADADENWSPKFNGLISSLLQRIDAVTKVPETDEIIKLLINLRGLISGSTYQNYVTLINYFFPDHIGSLVEAALKIPDTYVPLVRFLYEFNFNKESRMNFPAHSATGLLIFKNTAAALTELFGKPLELSENVEVIQYMLMIMNTILTNPCSNIGAIEVYEDPTLKDLFVAFFDFASRIGIMEFVNFKELSMPTTELIRTLFADFDEYIIEIRADFIPVALDLALQLLKNLDPTEKDNTKYSSTIEALAQFTINNREVAEFGEYLEQMMPIYDKVLETFERFILLRSLERAIYVNIVSLVIQLEPQSWPVIKARLRLYFANADEEQKELLYKILKDDDAEDDDSDGD